MASEPKYRQIADRLREAIASGEYPPGSKLPTEVELQDIYAVSRNTIRGAIELLTTRDLIDPRPGSGTYVVEKFTPFVTTLSGDWQAESNLGGGEGTAAFNEVEARDRTARVETPRIEIQQAAKNVATRLRVEPGTQVISRHQERYIDDQPWSLQTSFYPRSLAKQGADRLLDAEDIPEGTVKYLEETLHIKQAGYRDRIFARPPNKTEVEFFRLRDDAGTPVFVLLRTAYANGPDGLKPFRLTETVFPSDRNQFVISAGDVPEGPAEAAEVR
jgi:GntR family transcriptional regulator